MMISNREIVFQETSLKLAAQEAENDRLVAILDQREDDNQRAMLKAKAFHEAQELLREQEELMQYTMDRSRITSEVLAAFVSVEIQAAISKLTTSSMPVLEHVAIPTIRVYHHYHKDGRISDKPVKSLTRRHHRSVGPYYEEPEMQVIDVDYSKREVYHSTFSYNSVESSASSSKLHSRINILSSPERHFHHDSKCWSGSWADDYSSDDDDRLSPVDVLPTYAAPDVLPSGHQRNANIIEHISPTTQSVTVLTHLNPDIVWSNIEKRYVVPDYSPNVVEDECARRRLSDIHRRVALE